MSEITIRISDDSRVTVEQENDGIKSFKQIDPDTLIECINKSLLRGSVSSGLLPKNCLAFSTHDGGDRDVVLLHQESRADISFLDTEYKGFPLPRLVFGVRVSKEGRVSPCRLGVVANNDNIKPNTPMFHYPLSNVSGFALCTGNNVLPRCKSLYTLGSLPYLIMAMPNNLDHYSPANNRMGLEMRNLLELLKDKDPNFYYSDILVPNGKVLNDFINGRG